MLLLLYALEPALAAVRMLSVVWSRCRPQGCQSAVGAVSWGGGGGGGGGGAVPSWCRCRVISMALWMLRVDRDYIGIVCKMEYVWLLPKHNLLLCGVYAGRIFFETRGQPAHVCKRSFGIQFFHFMWPLSSPAFILQDAIHSTRCRQGLVLCAYEAFVRHTTLAIW